MYNLMRNPSISSELGYKIKKSRKIAEICRKTSKNIAKFLLILKCYFPFYKNKFFISAGSLFFQYSQHLKVPRKVGFEGVPLKRKNGSKKRAWFFYPCKYVHISNSYALLGQNFQNFTCLSIIKIKSELSIKMSKKPII